jgi:hypothetical protein
LELKLFLKKASMALITTHKAALSTPFFAFLIQGMRTTTRISAGKGQQPVIEAGFCVSLFIPD